MRSSQAHAVFEKMTIPHFAPRRGALSAAEPALPCLSRPSSCPTMNVVARSPRQSGFSSSRRYRKRCLARSAGVLGAMRSARALLVAPVRTSARICTLPRSCQLYPIWDTMTPKTVPYLSAKASFVNRYAVSLAAIAYGNERFTNPRTLSH